MSQGCDRNMTCVSHTVLRFYTEEACILPTYTVLHTCSIYTEVLNFLNINMAFRPVMLLALWHFCTFDMTLMSLSMQSKELLNWV